MALNWADWVILGVVLISALWGLKRGLIKEALSVANWIIALLIAVTFRDAFASLLVNHIESPSLRQLVAFGALFVTTLMVGALVNYLISALIKMTGLSATDRMLGAVFGFARGLVLVMAVLLLIPPIISIDQDLWWSQSTLIPNFMSFEGWARLMTGDVMSWLKQLFSRS